MAEGEVGEEKGGTAIPAKLQIAKGGGMHALLCLNGNSDELGVKQEIARALRNLCGDPLVRDAISTYGGIALFVEFAMCEDIELQSYSAQAMGLLAQDDDKRMAILREGGLRALLRIAQGPDAEAQMLATQGLVRISECREAKAGYAREGSAELLMLTRGGGHESAREDATRALGNLAEDLSSHPALLKNEAVYLLLAMMKDEASRGERERSPVVMGLAVRVLGRLSSGEEGRSQVMESEGIHGMVEAWLGFRGPGERGLREEACLLIVECSAKPQFASSLVRESHVLSLLCGVARRAEANSNEARHAALALCRSYYHIWTYTPRFYSLLMPLFLGAMQFGDRRRQRRPRL